MVKRGPHMRPRASEGEAQHGLFCWTRCIGQGDERLHVAQMMRVGLYRPVHVKTLRSQKLRMLLTHRKLLQSKAIAIENDLRATLRNFGLKVGIVGTVKFEARIKELV